MNRTYKLVWNAVSHSWVVASELAKGRKKSASKALKLALCIASVLGAGTAQAAPAPNTLPTGGSLSGNGVYSIDSSVPNQLTINQSEVALLATWNTFSIGSNARVIFNQPSSDSFTFNRVTGGSPSEIFGQVQANGHFVLVNPSGITFGAGSQVNAAAIVASTNPMGGVFLVANAYSVNASSSATAKVENYGTLIATAGGVTLLGSQVVNAGNIIATGGDVRLLNAGATNFNNGVPTSINPSAITGFIQNSGSITATQVSGVGGRILLTGDTSQTTSSISLSGTLTADDSISVTGKTITVDSALSSNGNTALTANDSINFDADLTVASNKTLALTYGSDTGEGYFLDHAAKVNLSGASAGFSVNGSSYTVINDVNDLQAMNSNLSGKYVLGSDIDASATSGWNSGAGFAPVASIANKFSGVLDGLGHAVNALTINRPSTDRVGLFLFGQNSIIQNIGLTNASITGRHFVGGLLGSYSSDSGTSGIYNSYVTGTVNGVGGVDVGGLVGRWDINTGSTGNISNSYSTATIQSSGIAGGLVGYLISNGGNGSVTNAYATGAVGGGSSVGGLVGTGSGSSGLLNISYSYWDTTTTGRNAAVGNLFGVTLTNVIGLGTSQLKNLSSFATWGSRIDASAGTGSTWRIYDGLSTPLLRSFLKPVTASVVNTSKTYDASTSFNGSYSLSSAASLLGTASYNTSSANVGQQALVLSGLYSAQTGGYDLNVVNGTGTINKASLTISSSDVTKTYDATTSAAGSAVAAGGTQLFGSDTLTGGTFAFTDKNAGTGKTVTVSGVTVNDGNNGGNYTVTYADNTNSSINKAALSITSTNASKTYDATTSANASTIISSGSLFGSDSLNGATFNYDDKNAGTGKHVIVSNALISDGNNGGNYDVTYVDNTSSSISKRLLTISAVADSKEYDGKLTSSATAKPVVVGRQRGDSIVGLTQSYLDKNAGTGKTINVDAGYTIRDGNGGNNYDVVIVNSNAGVITPKALTISTVANTKVYDGGVTSANKPVVTGLLTGDRITGLFQQYESKTVGTGKKLLIKAGYVVNDGNGGSNYSVTEQTSNDGVITVN